MNSPMPSNNPLSETVRDILDHVSRQRGIDFRVYRPGTIQRRLSLRLHGLNLADFDAYCRFLKDTPAELDALIDAFTVKVTHFFRNPLVFELLHSFILPGLLDSCKNETLRVWCAGCARGEEAYSLAMLLRDLAEKEALSPRIFILATDIDADALKDAERAVYRPEALLEVKKRRLDAYFTKEGGLYTVKPEVRSLVTLARHDVTSEGPPAQGLFSEYHLILCRNVLIYFNRAVHDDVLRRLSGRLPAGGALVLGEAERMTDDGFREIVPGTKIYRKEGPAS